MGALNDFRKPSFGLLATIPPLVEHSAASSNQVSGNFRTHAPFQTTFLEDLTDKKVRLLIERWRLTTHSGRIAL